MPIVSRATPIFRRRANYQINPGLHIVRRGMGITCPQGDIEVNGGCCDPSNYACASKVQASTQATQYSNAPGCYVINLANNECEMVNGQPLQCSAIRECDPLTGVQHCQYPLPGQNSPAQTANPTIPFCTGAPGEANVTQAQTPTGGTAFTPSGVNVAALTAAAVKAATQSNIQSSSGQPSTSSAPVTNGTPVATGPTAQSNAPAPAIASPTPIQSFVSSFMPSSDGSGDWISGIPNWVIIVGIVGVGGLLLFGGRR